MTPRVASAHTSLSQLEVGGVATGVRQETAGDSRWTLKQRFQIGIIALGLVGLLLLARGLRPAAAGFGTHQQLGLPPCTMVLVFGKRCPTCGITTSWANVTRGNVKKALAASVSGTFLAVLAAVSTVWLAISACRGRWTLVTPTPRGLAGVFVLVWLGLVCEWIVRLYGN
jgi:hypothetical protein